MILHLLLLSLALLSGKGVWAQKSPSSLLPDRSSRPSKLEGLYLNLGVGKALIPTSSLTPSGSFTALLQSGWGASVSIHYAPLNNVAVPSDYIEGSYLFGGARSVTNQFYSFSLTAVRKHYFGESRLVRWGWQAGPSLVQYFETEFVRAVPDPPDPFGGWGLGWGSSSKTNYNTQSVLRNTFGIQIAVNAAVLPARKFGLEANLWANINPSQPVVGLEACLLLGKVRSKSPTY